MELLSVLGVRAHDFQRKGNDFDLYVRVSEQLVKNAWCFFSRVLRLGCYDRMLSQL